MNTSKIKMSVAIFLMIVRLLLPITARIAIISAIVAFVRFLYGYGPKHTMDLLFSIVGIVTFPLRFPFLKWHEDLPLAIISAIIIYGGIVIALFARKSKFRWIADLMLVLPMGDFLYSVRYLWRAFRRHWNDPHTLFRSAKRYFRKAPLFGLSYFHLSPENRALLLETDPSVASRMDKLNAWFRLKFLETKFVPYIEKIERSENRTKYVCFRPEGFRMIDLSKEENANSFLHYLGYDPENHSVSVNNGQKFSIVLEDISKSVSILPFSQILPIVRKSEYVFGIDIDQKEPVRMKIDAGANAMLILLGRPGMGKSSLLSSLFVSLYEANSDAFRFVVTSTKPDLAYVRNLERVLKYADDPKEIVDAANLLLREIEARKKLFSSSGARDIVEYNTLLGVTKLPLVFAFFDELGDTLKALELQYGAKVLADYQKAITRLSITARAYWIVLVVATQSGLVSIFGQNGSEFRNSFSPVAFSLQTVAAETSVFGDSESGARRLPVWVCVWYDVSIGKYRKIRTPLVEKSDIDSFLARQGAKDGITDRENTEEKYFTFARSKGSLGLQDALSYGISERRYRTLCTKLQDSWEIRKLPNNTLVFVTEMQSENGLQNSIKIPRFDDCKSESEGSYKIGSSKTENM